MAKKYVQTPEELISFMLDSVEESLDQIGNYLSEEERLDIAFDEIIAARTNLEMISLVMNTAVQKSETLSRRWFTLSYALSHLKAEFKPITDVEAKCEYSPGK